MGFYVRPMPGKKSSPNWKVQFISYKEGKKEWDIPSDRWAVLGFNKFMTVKEAQARALQLNAQRYLKRQEHRIRKMQLDKQAARRRYEAFLPMEFVEEFEARFIRKRDSLTEAGGRRNTRAFVVWNAVQRMITTIAVEPSEWFTATHQIYDYFVVRKMSLKYSCTIIKIANLWGFYFCRKLARPFLPVPLPRGYERMLSKNQTLENISIWMGHSTIQRTWTSYKQRRKFPVTGF